MGLLCLTRETQRNEAVTTLAQSVTFCRSSSRQRRMRSLIFTVEHIILYQNGAITLKIAYIIASYSSLRFNPDFGPYGFSSWPGHLAHNAFNNSELEPYTGRLPIDDYLDDLQLPQMMILAYQYDTEIMWCDIGGPNKTLDFAAQYYNHAWVTGRQVTINNSMYRECVVSCQKS